MSLSIKAEDDSRRCWKGHEIVGHSTGVIRFGIMMWTCHKHFDELKQYPVDDPNWVSSVIN